MSKHSGWTVSNEEKNRWAFRWAGGQQFYSQLANKLVKIIGLTDSKKKVGLFRNRIIQRKRLHCKHYFWIATSKNSQWFVPPFLLLGCNLQLFVWQGFKQIFKHMEALLGVGMNRQFRSCANGQRKSSGLQIYSKDNQCSHSFWPQLENCYVHYCRKLVRPSLGPNKRKYGRMYFA